MASRRSISGCCVTFRMPLSGRSSDAISANTSANDDGQDGPRHRPSRSGDSRLIAHAHHPENRDAVQHEPDLGGNPRLNCDRHARSREGRSPRSASRCTARRRRSSCPSARSRRPCPTADLCIRCVSARALLTRCRLQVALLGELDAQRRCISAATRPLRRDPTSGRKSERCQAVRRATASSRTSARLAAWRSETIPNVNASMNAASPRIAPAIADTGDSFSSSDRRCVAEPDPIPRLDGEDHDDERRDENDPDRNGVELTHARLLSNPMTNFTGDARRPRIGRLPRCGPMASAFIPRGSSRSGRLLCPGSRSARR